MELPWLDLPFTLLTLLLATRLAYDYYGVVAATFTGSFSLQIFLFYCFARCQADVVAYALCLANILVMVVWLSPDAAADPASAAKSFLRLSDDEDEGSGSGSGHGAAEDKCCVCLAGMREAQALRDLPRCGHRFHAKCIGKWLTAHPTCPVCRATAVPPPPPLPAGGDHADDAITPV
uniref:RING-type domain-containing protein n=1 Tax=Oryza barthii TaxID=65489 RepID=A0A0D3GHH1_9ORYZ